MVRLNAVGAHLVATGLIETLLAESGHLPTARLAGVAGPHYADAIDQLIDLGFPLVFEHDGLRWRAGAPTPLSAERIRAFVSQSGLVCDVDCVALTDSTNARLLAQAVAGESGPCALLAECQTAGRGRRQRRWQARFGESLLFSVLLDSGRRPSELPGLAIAVGVTVANALSRLGVEGVALKWPNDIQLSGSKLAGVLVEAPGRAASQGLAVVGVGLNWQLSEAACAGIDQPAADLSALARTGEIDRTEIAGRLIVELIVMAQRFRKDGLAAFLDDYARFDVLAGRAVDVRTETGRRQGVALGLAEDGALRVAHPEGECRYRSADVSVRIA